MFKWYLLAQVCYVYLSDVPTAEQDPHTPTSHFRCGQWFERGWTLQELIAPDQVEFYDRNWEEIGTKGSLQELVEEITGITHLFYYRDASVAQKMSWASRRKTTIVEDQAYCLLGVFGVNMPLLYGEGNKAFLRLQIEIANSIDDDSIFAWEGFSGQGLLARSPEMFTGSGNIVQYINGPHRLEMSSYCWYDGSIALRFQGNDAPTFALIITRNLTGTWLDVVFSEAPLSQLAGRPTIQPGVRGKDRIVKSLPSEPRSYIKAAIRMTQIEGSPQQVVTVALDRARTSGGECYWRAEEV